VCICVCVCVSQSEFDESGSEKVIEFVLI